MKTNFYRFYLISIKAFVKDARHMRSISSLFTGCLAKNEHAHYNGRESRQEASNLTLQQLKYVIAIADTGSVNAAAKNLYLSQPSLSGSVRDLEEELGFALFRRSNRGVTITAEGEAFLNYARQVWAQYALLESRFLMGKSKRKFSVSAQHYTFAVNAFSALIGKVGMDEYEFSMLETKTYECIENVRDYKSELGILYVDDFNRKYILKCLDENNLEFHPLKDCATCVYLWQGHPLAQREQLSLEDLEFYPCIAFEIGKENSLFLSEEVMSTYQYRQLIRVCDRATALNFMKGINGYTLCSGIICEELNGGEYKAIPLSGGGVMTIGYIQRRGSSLSRLGELYLNELKKAVEL